MSNQQKYNIDFLYKTLRKRSSAMMLAFHLNPSLFNQEMDKLIKTVIHRDWGYEGYYLKYHLYIYLEETKSIVGGAIGNYNRTLKAINDPNLKNRRKILKEIISISRKE